MNSIQLGANARWAWIAVPPTKRRHMSVLLLARELEMNGMTVDIRPFYELPVPTRDAEAVRVYSFLDVLPMTPADFEMWGSWALQHYPEAPDYHTLGLFQFVPERANHHD